MTSRPASPADGDGGGGDTRTAQKLLKPKRRQQIEIWLDEAVHWERSQSCAVGRSSDHSPAGLPGPPAPPAPPPSRPSSVSPPAPPCQVCGRYFTGEEGEGQQQPPAPAAAAASPAAQPSPPGGPRGRGGNPGRAVQMFRGVMSALRISTESGRADEGVWDPALSTRMFLVEATNDDGGDSDSSAASRFSSNGGKQALDGRMARLRRAQKLLEKSQPKVG